MVTYPTIKICESEEKLNIMPNSGETNYGIGKLKFFGEGLRLYNPSPTT
jgi:hypothetical protein